MFRTALLFLFFVHSAVAAHQFLAISDIHYGIKNSSMDGQDTGTEFLEITLNKFKELTKDVDFILNLGDLPTHTLLINSEKEENERTLFHGLYEADQSLKPMFYITGNNDSLSGNYQPFEKAGKSPLNFAEDWTGACVHCDGLMIDDTHMRHHGYYSSYVIPDNKEVMLIALNTIEWTKVPVLLPRYPNQERDAFEQLYWLERQLKDHKAEQLLIAMHVPPGNAYKGGQYWYEIYLKRFIKLLDKYHHLYGQITLLTGHTHMDGFRKIRLSDGTAVYGYSIPGISRIHHNNPGMKVFIFDNKYRIKDFITYYTTSLTDWTAQQYHALGDVDAIFPKCTNLTVSQCLDVYNDEQICNRLDENLFYSVKSPRVPLQGCLSLYKVN